jgi:hypothetical protein
MDGSKVEALRMLDAYEDEVGAISESLRLPVRVLRKRVSECLEDSLLPHRFEVPFVGRDEEFAELRALLLRTHEGATQCVVITGEAGLGKTRIANELLRLAVLDGCIAVTYAASSGDTLSPFSSLLGLSTNLLGQRGALGCAQEQLHFLRRLISPDDSLPEPGSLSSEITYAQLAHALSELLSAIADEAPVLLFIDDAQRLHQTSWRILTDAIGRLATRPVLVIFAARSLPEGYAALGRSGSDLRFRHMRLRPLGYQTSREYLDAWSDRHGTSLSDRDSHDFALTAEGNPFYLGELACHVTRGGDSREAPASIRDLVGLQYAASSKHAQRALLVVSLLQARASITRVSAILELTPSEFVAALEELESAGLLAATGTTLRLKHEIIGDVTVGLAMPGVLGYLRARIAALLESEARDTDSFDLLADSLGLWEKIGDSQKTLNVGIRLGERLLTVGLGAEAHEAFARAGAAAVASEDRCRIVEGQIQAASLAADAELTLRHFQKWRELRGGRPHATSTSRRIELLAAEASLVAAGTPAAYADFLRMAASHDHTLPIPERLRLVALCAMVADQFYDDNAIRSLTNELLALTDHLDESIYGRVAELICSLASKPVAAIQRMAQSLEGKVAQHDDLRLRLVVPRWISTVYRRVGDFAPRIELIHRALREAVDYRLPNHAAAHWEHLTDTYVLLGRIDEARAALAHLEQIVTEGSMLHTAYAVPNRAMLAYHLQDMREASRVLSILEKPRPHPFPFSEHVWLTCRVAVQLMIRRDHLCDEDIRQLVNLHRRALPFGFQDDRFVVLHEALSTTGRQDEAADLEKTYLNQRRSLNEPALIRQTPAA